MDPVEFYVEYAYDALTNGNWEWKDDRTLGQQLIIIANNQIGKQVEKYRRENDPTHSVTGDDLDELCYSDDSPPNNPTQLQELLYEQQLQCIETAVREDKNLQIFWMCIKEGMKRQEIADFMEKTPKQIDKLREKLINKVKNFL